MTNWQDILKKPFKEDPDEMTDFMNISPRMKTAKLERQILREIEKEGGALGMKNLKQFGEEEEIKQALSKLRKEGKIFMHEDGDIYTHKPEDIEKFFGRNKPQKLTKDGIIFTEQRALDIYNQNVSKYPSITNALTGKTVNTASVETALDNAARTQRGSQQYQQRPKRKLSPRMPTDSDFRRPAY